MPLAANLLQATVQALVNAVPTTPGDPTVYSITLPANNPAVPSDGVWETPVTVGSRKIDFQGAGEGNTIIYDQSTASGAWSAQATSTDKFLKLGGFTLVKPRLNSVIGTNGIYYYCIKPNLNLASARPISGASWATYWAQNSTVTQSGNTYQCIQSHTSNITNGPPPNPGSAGYWQLNNNAPAAGAWVSNTSYIGAVPTVWSSGTQYFKHVVRAGATAGMIGLSTANVGTTGQVSFWLHDIRFNLLSNGSDAVIVFSANGLFNSCYWDLNGVNGGAIHCVAGYGSGPGGGDGGFIPWAYSTSSLGTQRAIVFEDCTLDEPTHLANVEVAVDGFAGVFYVFRHNTFINCYPGWHGCDSGLFRSGLGGELYDNTYINNSTVKLRACTVRGGQVVAHDNSFSTPNNPLLGWDGYTLQYFRVGNGTIGPISTWGQCGLNNWELNGAAYPTNRVTSTTGGFRFAEADNATVGDETVNGGLTYTKYMDGPLLNAPGGPVVNGSGYPGRDQPGRGPRQVLAPCYQWNNGTFNALGPYTGGTAAEEARLAALVAPNREYFNGNPSGGPALLVYTHLAYPHPLRGFVIPDTLAPAAPTGVIVT